MINRFALGGLRCDAVSMRQVLKLPVDGPAIGEANISRSGEILDRVQSAIIQPVFSVLRRAIIRDANCVSFRQRNRAPPKRGEAIRMFQGKRRIADDETLALAESGHVLVKLNHFARVIHQWVPPALLSSDSHYAEREMSDLSHRVQIASDSFLTWGCASIRREFVPSPRPLRGGSARRQVPFCFW